ncbi:acyl-CoA dehydrogenase family protein [Niveispirillum sp.]|uniref:acyl-CoA dehydrogenase family protein n=1 Tax=Niveispirillum sp. TaxID=1917217 RepID=UPI001B5FC3BD|nr:acyl-CoA dehydrogenase family protein [Niveispirillum sp.]MBP7334356.1 acyl-CoA/acyl-ACP dehydrogenase [Niveispirillum sp.]
MNFDFSDDVTAMRREVQAFLADRLPVGAVRQFLENGPAVDGALWAEMAAMGWLGLTIPEEYGGSGLGHEALCMLAEEVGAFLPPVPFASTLYLAAEALLGFGSDAQKAAWLPRLADGSVTGAFALAEGAGEPGADGIRALVEQGRLSGSKAPVFDLDGAGLLIVAARDAAGQVGLYLIDPAAPGMERRKLRTLDLAHGAWSAEFHDVAAEPLPGAVGWPAIARLLDRAAVLFAFEQVGGGRAALEMATSFAMDRFAFGRPIASMQAIKHKLADIYVAVELARSNAYFGAWALHEDAAELPRAAASARIAAIDAYQLAARENIQTHGGMGFTWEADCHLHYRRAATLAGIIGGARHWRDRLFDQLAA